RASRKFWTAAVGSLASSGVTASARPVPRRKPRPTSSRIDARTVAFTAQDGRRFAFRVVPIVATHRQLTSARDDLETAREFAVDDASFADEVTELETRVDELETKLSDMLAPRDPHDADDVVLEVKSGEGGEESALFAADLARMYIRYAERHGWNVTVLDETYSDLGGYKDATLTISSKGDSADGVWSRLKFEGGVHRVQRGPVTESQGRGHTSAAGVLVYPEPV